MVTIRGVGLSILDKLRASNSFRKVNRVCPFCKKTFCCTECRDRHVNVAHPDLNASCTLCSARTLPMRQHVFEKLSLEEAKLLSHITTKHLPLHCILCGDQYKTEEDLKSLGKCKWYHEHYQLLMCDKLSLPRTPAQTNLQANSKQSCTISNCSTFLTPPEVYRNTSTPMFLGQKNECETPCLSNFSLKTPNTISPQVARTNSTSCIHESSNADSNTKFFSFSPQTTGNEEMTPFRTPYSEQFSRSNSGRIFNINNEAEDVKHEGEVTSPVDMDLTDAKGGLLQDCTKLDTVHEESDEASNVMKKVRFFDQLKFLPNNHQATFCVKSVLNITEEEVFHDARDVSHAKYPKSPKNTEDNATNTENTKNTEDTKITKYVEEPNAKPATRENQVMVQKQVPVNCPKNFVKNSQVDHIFQDNKKNEEKENHGAQVLINNLSTTDQPNGSTSRVLMMLLVENNAGELSTNLIPLISSGLKKLEEQIASTSSNMAAPSNIANGCTRRSTTRLSISTVESYSNNNARTDHRPATSSSSSSLSVQNGESSNSGGILSTVAQAVKYAFKNLSGATSNNIPRTQMIIEETTSSPGASSTSSSCSSSSSASSNLESNLETRPGKRGRDTTEISSRMDPLTRQIGIQSPLAKRQRGWYKMVKGRQPIRRMLNNDNQVTSPRRVSSETQVFSQGSLTVGDTVLPLPGRAHNTQTN